jgi:nicotinate-nucleotide adenylyltransferase
VQVAIENIQGLCVDDRELRRNKPSYTIETLEDLRHEYPDSPLCLIIGMDAFLKLDTWHKWENLLHFGHLLIVQREGQNFPDNHRLAPILAEHRTENPQALKQQNAGLIFLQDIPKLDISATYIRHLFAKGKNPRYLIPSAVLGIIETYHLYR